MKVPNITFDDFLRCFPEENLPVTLTDETISDFQRQSTPLKPQMIEQYINPMEGDAGEYTEYVACLRIPQTHDMHALVYWRGDLMNYRYVLATFNQHGAHIANAIIAGTESDGQTILKSVATIDEDWVIHIVEGELRDEHTQYQPRMSRAFQMELLATGEVIMLDAPE